ncbi:MAG: HAMP domain-containing sensor histidine kinase [Pseudomonadota bacterium]
MLDPAGDVGGTRCQEMEDFVYLISHDLRGSVRALTELPEWIIEDLREAEITIDERLGASIDMMRTHMRRLDRMLVDLLTFSRIGRMQNVHAVELSSALASVVGSLDIPESFKISSRFDCSTLWIGERDILTLLSALLENAIKHHDACTGHVELCSRIENQMVVLEVADDGPGIPPRFQERVFAPMVTLRPRDEVEASGMGLANVRKIATFYGGSAQLLPVEKGCRISVRLPIKKALP